jgi:outer membrane receptor protein involved in Fe transport
MRTGDNWQFVIGGRYDHLKYRAEDYAAGVRRSPAPDELTFERVTPKAAIRYALTQDHALYVSISGGLEVPAFNEVDPPPSLSTNLVNPLLKPMTSTTVEIGGNIPWRHIGST